MRVNQIKDAVRLELRNDKACRSNDKLLIARIWYAEISGEGDMKVKDFLNLFATTKKLSNPESIRRCRQKIQEEEPVLRGSNYGHRQAEQKVVQEDLGYE